MEKRLLTPSPPAVQSWYRKGMSCPQEGLHTHRRMAWSLQAALLQPVCRLSAHPTSLLQKSRKKKWQSLQAIGLRSKEKAETSILLEQCLTQAQRRGIYSLPLLFGDSQGFLSECTWNMSYTCTCLGESSMEVGCSLLPKSNKTVRHHARGTSGKGPR